MSKSRIWFVLYKSHAWVGLFAGLFLLIICLSGAVAIFNPEIERATDWSSRQYDIASNGAALITIEQAIATAQGAYPGATASLARYPDFGGSAQSHGKAYSVLLNRGRGEGSLDVMVHPYEQRILATMRPNNGWGHWVRDLHVRFLYGSYWGRWLVGIFGLLLLLLCISGLFLFPRFNGGSWRPKIRWGRSSRIVWADLHKVLGLATVAFHIMFGLSGAVLGLEGLYRKYIMAPLPPAVRLQRVSQLPPGFIESSVSRACELIPAGKPAAVTLSHAKTGTIRVQVETSPLSLIKEGASYVSFNAQTGEPVEVYDARNASLSGRFYFAMEPLHFGRLGGSMIVKLIWAAIGVSGGLLSVTGFLVFILRKWPAKVAKGMKAPAVACLDQSAADSYSHV